METYLEPQVVKSAMRNAFMKPEDCELIPLAKELFDKQVEPLSPDRALFYPSAGKDLITPLIIALPYCSQFYFYDHALTKPRLRSSYREVFNYICQIKGLTTSQTSWVKDTNDKTLNFQYCGNKKTLRWVGNDNLEFLTKTDLNLAFYFHRGDSYGEGGSGQFWDSELLDDLIKIIKPDCKCFFITDGHPGGPSFKLLNAATILEIEGSYNKYYLGLIKPR